MVMLVFKADVKAVVFDKECGEITSVFKHELSEIEIKTVNHALKGSGLKLIMDETSLNKSFSVKTKQDWDGEVNYDPRLGKILDWKEEKHDMLKKVQFKSDVYGFVYDSADGEVTKVFTTPLNESELKLVSSVLGEDDCVFTDIEQVNELFDFSDGSLECDVEGLNTVLEYAE
jgi:hypothetical protein